MKIDAQKMKYFRQYIRENYGELPLAIISEDLGISKYYIRKIAGKMGLKISEEQRIELSRVGNEYNPNPVTLTTHMLVCKYHHEGDSIQKISFFLMRPPEVIEEILRECKKSGFYYKVNRIKADTAG